MFKRRVILVFVMTLFTIFLLPVAHAYLGFNITTTGDFLDGTFSDSLDNLDIETWLDNYRIQGWYDFYWVEDYESDVLTSVDYAPSKADQLACRTSPIGKSMTIGATTCYDMNFSDMQGDLGDYSLRLTQLTTIPSFLYRYIYACQIGEDTFGDCTNQTEQTNCIILDIPDAAGTYYFDLNPAMTGDLLRLNYSSGVQMTLLCTNESDTDKQPALNGSYLYSVEEDEDGEMALCDLHSDRFTFDDDDGLTYKWVEGDLWGMVDELDFIVDISDGTYNMRLYNTTTNGYAQVVRALNWSYNGSFDTKIDMYLPAGDNLTDYYEGFFVLYDSTSENFAVLDVYGDTYWQVYYEISTESSGNYNSTIPVTEPFNASFRVKRYAYETCYIYIDEFMSGEWDMLLGTDFCFDGDSVPMIFGYASAVDDDGEILIKWDNFEGDYWADEILQKDEGTWTSGNITLDAQSVLNETTIKFYNPYWMTCIDSVEWLMDGVPVATYDTQICNYTTYTYNKTVENADFGGRNYLFDFTTGTWYGDGVYGVVDDNSSSYGYGQSAGVYLYLTYKIPKGATTNSRLRVDTGDLIGGGHSWKEADISDGCITTTTELDIMLRSYTTRDGPLTTYCAVGYCYDHDGESWDMILSSCDLQAGPNYIYDEEILFNIEESSITINNSMLTSGEYFGALFEDEKIFNIRLNLTASGGNVVPTVKEISGNYLNLTCETADECPITQEEIDNTNLVVIWLGLFAVLSIAYTTTRVWLWKLILSGLLMMNALTGAIIYDHQVVMVIAFITAIFLFVNIVNFIRDYMGYR